MKNITPQHFASLVMTSANGISVTDRAVKNPERISCTTDGGCKALSKETVPEDFGGCSPFETYHQIYNRNKRSPIRNHGVCFA